MIDEYMHDEAEFAALSPALADEPSPGDSPELGGVARNAREWMEAIADLHDVYVETPWPEMVGAVDLFYANRMTAHEVAASLTTPGRTSCDGYLHDEFAFFPPEPGDRIHLTLDGRIYTAGSSADMATQLRDSGYGVEESHNGVYTITAVGSASTPWTLTRDVWSPIPGAPNRRQRRAAQHGKTWQPDNRRPWERRA